MPKNRKSTEKLIQKMIDHQQSRVLKVAREIVPNATPEDIRNPQDFPQLLADSIFNYEDGILTGYLSLQTALRNQIKTEDFE
ncbi:MAG: hypothetical protein CL935_00545 [Deltaproteobacteria bacterium]|nr:hypothetical protein [Deltaproteobacteria bacterium]|tara:strand:- start:129 stop:374 length:246 start_codon:yes stop_codon:yes gene_type:complete